MTEPFRIDVDDGAALAVLAGLASPAAAAELKRAERAGADVLAQNIRETFRQEADPWGRAWPHLSAKTLKRREQRNNASVQILIDSGAMFGSIHVAQNTAGSIVSAGEGLPDPRAPANQFGNGRAPARAFFPIAADGDGDDLPAAWAAQVMAPIERTAEALLKADKA